MIIGPVLHHHILLHMRAIARIIDLHLLVLLLQSIVVIPAVLLILKITLLVVNTPNKSIEERNMRDHLIHMPLLLLVLLLAHL